MKGNEWLKKNWIAIVIGLILIFAVLYAIKFFINKLSDINALKKGKNPISGEDYSEEEISLQVNAASYIKVMEEGLEDCYTDCSKRCLAYKKWDEELNEDQLLYVAAKWKEKNQTEIIDEIESRWRTGCGWFGIEYGRNIVNRLTASN
jgi:hypothetical protein